MVMEEDEARCRTEPRHPTSLSPLIITHSWISASKDLPRKRLLWEESQVEYWANKRREDVTTEADVLGCRREFPLAFPVSASEYPQNENERGLVTANRQVLNRPNAFARFYEITWLLLL